MSKKVSIRYLIDVAIGTPEPGIVNFNALYTVLQAISEKLDLEDEQIEIDSSFCPVATNTFDSKSNVSSERLMKHQVYDVPTEYNEERRILSTSKRSGEIFRNENSTESKEAHSSLSLKNRQTTEDRKVAFGRRENKKADEETLSSHGAKKSKNLEIEQQIDHLYNRLEKVENFATWSVDTEQSVECLRQIVHKIHDKLDLLERSVYELRNNRYEEEDISACRIKLDYDKLKDATNALKTELDSLKDSINGGGSKNLQMKNILKENLHDPADIKRLDIQLTDLKTNVCIFNEKLKNLEEIIAKTDNCSSMVTLDFFEREISSLKTQIESTTFQIEQQMLRELAQKLDEIRNSKIDKAEVDELLSEKVDYSMLHGKVSEEIMAVEHRKFEKQLAEIADCLIINEDQVKKQIDGIKKLVGDENLKDLLHDFKSNFNKEIQRVSDSLQKLSEIKPDKDSAVTRLKELTCLSCDQDVVMKAVQINNLSRFSDARVSKTISPSITFDVGRLRQIRKVGRFYDDAIIFELEKKIRNSGGVHTIITNKDRISKTRQRKSK